MKKSVSEKLIHAETEITQNNGERLQKFLASLGVASRRDIEKFIASGRIKVNDKIATPGIHVGAKDKIMLDNHLIKMHARDQDFIPRVLVYNKPIGEVVTRRDEKTRSTVFDKLPRIRNGRWINIGRLDINTAGLLLFTNDGVLAHTMMHPSSNIDREYAIRIHGEVTDEVLEQLKMGVDLEDGIYKFTDVQRAPYSSGTNQWFHCVVMEGKHREVRRIWESQGLQVSRLKRVRFGPVFMDAKTTVGKYRELEPRELKVLYEDIGLDFDYGMKSYRKK